MFPKIFDFPIVHFSLGVADFPFAHYFKIFPLSLDCLSVGEDEHTFSCEFISKTFAYILETTFEFEMSINFDAIKVVTSKSQQRYLK